MPAERKKDRKRNRKDWTLSIFASLICAEYVIASSPETFTSGLAYNADQKNKKQKNSHMINGCWMALLK